MSHTNAGARFRLRFQRATIAAAASHHVTAATLDGRNHFQHLPHRQWLLPDERKERCCCIRLMRDAMLRCRRPVPAATEECSGPKLRRISRQS
jgi:hypothetical protein